MFTKPFSPENIAGLHFPAFLADGCGLIVEMNCVTSQLKWPRAGVYLPFFLSLTMRTEDLWRKRQIHTSVCNKDYIYTDSTHKNSHVDSDVSVLKVSRAMNNEISLPKASQLTAVSMPYKYGSKNVLRR